MIDPLHRVSVRSKLALLFVGLCLIAYGVGGSLVSHGAEQALEREIHTRLGVQARAYGAALAASLELFQRRTEDFASDGYIRDRTLRLVRAGLPAGATDASHDDDAPQLRADLRQHLERNKLPLEDAFQNLAVVAPDGTLLAIVHADSLALLSERSADAGPFLDDAGGLVIVRPLRELDGDDLVGRLLVRVRVADWVAQALPSMEGAEPGAQASLVLRAPDGRRLLARPAALEGSPPVVLAERGRGADAPLGSSPLRGTFRHAFPIAGSGWQAEVTLDVDEVLRPVSGLKSQLLLVGLVLALSSSLLLFFPMRFVVLPLIELTRAAERLREGDLQTRVPVTSHDEIGALGRAFNGMADAIQDRTRRLEVSATNLRERQAELGAERDRLDAVIASMHDGLVVFDAAGRVVLSNGAARPLLELVERDRTALGRHVCLDETARPQRPGDGDDSPEGPTHDCFHCLLEVAGPPRSCTIDVGPRSFEVHTTPLPPDPGGRRGRVLVARELTDRIQQDEREIHNERLAVLGEVAAVMAHEINNPLASISMFNQLLRAELPADSPLRENTEVIARNTEAATRTIRELLDYATGSTPEVGPVDMHAVLEDARRFLHPISERSGVGVALRPQAQRSWVIGDEVQLRQVVVNLALNAIQAVAGAPAAPGGGRGARRGEVVLSTHDDGERLAVDVTDSGPGVAAEHRARLFRPFFTTKARGEGTGLGLSTARRIAEMHGGSLELVETAEPGTTFRIQLRTRSPAAAGLQPTRS